MHIVGSLNKKQNQKLKAYVCMCICTYMLWKSVVRIYAKLLTVITPKEENGNMENFFSFYISALFDILFY